MLGANIRKIMISSKLFKRKIEQKYRNNDKFPSIITVTQQ